MTELAGVGSTVSMSCQMAGFVATLFGAQGFNLDRSAAEVMKFQILQPSMQLERRRRPPRSR